MRQMSQPVHSITDAPVRHSVEQRSRMVRYTIAMSIRLVCFVAAAVVAVVWETWWALVPALAATVLPYIAVVNANAGGDRYAAQRADEAPQRQLSTGHEDPEPRQWWEQNEPDEQQAPDTSAVIDGDVEAEPKPSRTESKPNRTEPEDRA